MSLQARWRAKPRNVKREVFALRPACRDPRAPRYAKALAAGVVACAFSVPIDLIPDFIPVVGYLDELVLVPLGVLAVRAMIPRRCRRSAGNAAAALEPGGPVSVLGPAIIAVIGLALAALGILLVRRWPWPSS